MSKKYEPLFKSDSDWHNNACLNFLHDMSHGYIEGYKIAGDELVVKVNDTGRNQDFLVYPIVFLYRQHIELLLKSIINSGRQLLSDESGHPTHHKIDQLWPIVKGIVRRIWPGKDPDEFELIDHVITELSEADPASMSFRYPKDKNGNKYNPELVHINLRHLGQTIDQVSTFLSGIETGVEYDLEEKYEYLSDIF